MYAARSCKNLLRAICIPAHLAFFPLSQDKALDSISSKASRPPLFCYHIGLRQELCWFGLPLARNLGSVVMLHC